MGPARLAGPTVAPMPKLSITNALWFLGWLATLLVVAWLLWTARQRVVADLNRPEARADWQQWQRDEAARQADATAPVRRRPPKSAEPPALILLRDSFPAIAAVCMLAATICYGFVMLALRGIFAGAPPDQARKQAT